MEDLTDVIDYTSWTDTTSTGNLPWNCCTDSITMNTMNMDASCRAVVPRNTLDMPTIYGYAGGLLERQGLISQDYGMQGSQTQPFIHNRVLNHPHSDDIFFGAQPNQSPNVSSLSELNSHFQSHPRGTEPVTDAIFQSFSRDGIPIDIHNFRKRQAYTDVSKLAISNQDRIQQNKCNGQYSRQQPQAAPGGPTKPRTRARRGQATDPHSIAERLRRERIANRLKLLQDLVPNSNKPDKAAMLDDIIEYVRFLQLQSKVFGMSRLGGTGAVAPLVADVSTESHSSLGSSMLPNNISGATGTPRDHNTEALEEEVANLMEADVSKAMRFLQSKGLCLMPISLATAISRMDMRHSTDDSEVIY